MTSANFFIKNRLIGWLLVSMFMLFGGSAYLNMPRFEDPEFLIRTAQIVTEYPGASPEEIADEVIDPIESEIQGMQEVLEIRSTAYFGYAIISVDIKHEFSSSRDELNLIWTRLRAKVNNSENKLPPSALKPVVNDDYGDVFGLYYMVTGEGFSNMELDNYAQELRKQLLTVNGVAKVATVGKQQEIIAIEFSRDRASSFGVNVEDVFNDLAQQNSVVPAGSVLVGENRLTIFPNGQLSSLESIRNVMISVANSGELVRLGDIATIERDDLRPSSYIARYNGKPAVAIGIANVSGTNVVAIGEKIRSLLAETEVNRPLGIKVQEFYHQGDAVNEAVNNFALNVLAALIIVLITLLIFMGIQSAVIIGAVLTVTIAATLATMYFVEIPMHRISLGALIIALGMLVDNAIVVTEGILVESKKGKTITQAAQHIVGKTRWALLGGTVVGILAFAPIGFAPGDTAEYTNHLFWVIFISLFYSWIFAILLVPMFADKMFSLKRTKDDKNQKEANIISGYKAILKFAIKRRWSVILFTLSIFIVAIIGLGNVKEGFFPTSTTPQIAIDYWLPESSDITATSDDVEQIEQVISKLDGVDSVYSNIGAGALRYMLIYSPEVNNGAYAQLILKIDDLGKIDNLITEIQRYIDKSFPNAQARVWRFVLGPSQGSKIEATFQGPDPLVLRELEAKAFNIMAQNDNAVAIKSDWRQQSPVIQPIYDEVRGSRLGISREAFANALNANFTGRNLGVFREKDELIPIVFRAPESERNDIALASQIQIPTSVEGMTVPLSEVMRDKNIVWRDSQMLRENRSWTLRVQADPIPGVLASELLSQLRPEIESIALPPGYSLRWDGEYGDSVKANAELAQTLPLGLLAMIIVVVLLFNALKQPMVIWLVVPLALIGVVIGLLITDTALEFMAILGVLSLSGLLIKNAIVLVDQMDDEIAQGKPRLDAVVDSCTSRLRPVMMGALTTILGVVPLLSDVFFASMAVVITFGLTFATLLTLIIVPVLYTLFFNINFSETKAI